MSGLIGFYFGWTRPRAGISVWQHVETFSMLSPESGSPVINDGDGVGEALDQISCVLVEHE